MTNPLVAETRALSATHAMRLYVLTRDAYLSHPAGTVDKLGALEDLRRVVTDSGIPQGDLPGITAISGVRLMERLRLALRTFHAEFDDGTRHLVLVDVLTSTWPPTGAGPAADLTTLVSDAGTHFAPEISVAQIHRLARQHRSTVRALSAWARRGRGERLVAAADAGAVPAVRDMVAEVLGLCAPAATCASLVLLGGGKLDGGRHGLAGGAILEGLGGDDAFVGTALARIDPDALVHQLAALDTMTTLRPQLRISVRELLMPLLADIDEAVPASLDEQLRLGVGRRAISHEIRRLAAPAALRWTHHPRTSRGQLRTEPGTPRILGA